MTNPTVQPPVRSFGMLHYVRHAFRQLQRSKRFAATSGLTLALGIGTTTAVFAVLNAVVLRPLPYADPDRLMAFRFVDRRGGDSQVSQLSYPNFFDFREQNQAFKHLVSYRDSPFTLTDAHPPIPVTGEIVSWDLFALLGIQLERGRGFLPEEEQPGRNVAVISHTLWAQHFGGDEQIVGNAISINGRPYTVVGVAPEGFQFPIDVPAVQIWVTLAEDAVGGFQRGARMLDVIGRLKPGISAAQARAQMDGIAAVLAQQYPDSNRNIATTWIQEESERATGAGRKALWVMLAAVSVVLFIACANVASLLLARSSERAREFCLRTALGASRGALMRQLLVESFTLGLLGTAGGVLLAFGGLKAILPLAGDRIPRLAEVGVDARVLAFAGLMALLTSVLFGLAPALQVAASDPVEGIKAGARSVTPTRDRLRSALVVCQIALGLVLLVAASLFMNGLLKLTRVDPGFRTDHLVTFDLSLPEAYTPERQTALSDRVLERMAAMPGVQHAAAGSPLPLQGHEMRIAFVTEGRPAAAGNRPRSDVAIVTPGYFAAMGIPLLNGRDFSAHDNDGAQPVVIVNEAFARTYFPGENALGKRMQPGAGSSPVMREIVGIVGDARQTLLSTNPDPVYYFPFRQLPWRMGTIVLRTSAPPSSVSGAIRAALAEVDARVTARRVQSGEELAAGLITPARFVTVLMGTFAGIALLLTLSGLYGLLSYMVARRRREIGVRIALGAARRDVITMVVRRAAWLVAPGLIVGAAGAAVTGRVLGSVVFGVPPSIALTVAGACALIVVTAGAAALVPATKAASIDPTQALRTE